MQLKTLLTATTCAIAALTATITCAQTYPNKPLRMIVPSRRVVVLISWRASSRKNSASASASK